MCLAVQLGLPASHVQLALTRWHRIDLTLPHPDAVPSNQPCWLPVMGESSFLPSLHVSAMQADVLAIPERARRHISELVWPGSASPKQAWFPGLAGMWPSSA